MSEKERRYLCWLEEVVSGKSTLGDAAVGMRVSYRQARRLLKRYRESGDSGLVHGLRGQASTRKAPAETKSAILKRYAERYGGFGPTLASEHLTTDDNLPVKAETLRLWLVEAGLWQARPTRCKHRTWRERKARFGEMVQGDGSIHDWFEGRAPKCFLMSFVDDATGVTLLQFTEQETTRAAMDMTEAWVGKYGVPESLYLDRKSVYITDREQTREEQLAGKPALTQFGSACHKLDIRIIAAHSPQAKGRVERKHGVCQDRLVKEMRLAGIASIAEANAFLAAGWLEDFNRKFAKPPREEADAHRPAPKDYDPQRVFCLEEIRVVRNDFTIRYEKVYYQILKQKSAPPPGSNVTVQQRRDGSVAILGKDGPLNIIALDKAPEKTAPVKAEPKSKAHIPAENHPWRGIPKPGEGRVRPKDIEELAQTYLPTPSYLNEAETKRHYAD